MAILKNLVTRGATKRAGGLTFYQKNGRTIMRESENSVTESSNPRSKAQMIQRAKFKNTVAFYQVSKLWMEKGAFQKKNATLSDYNAFVSANTKLQDAVYLTKGMTEQGGCLILPYVVSVGTIPSVNNYYDTEAGEFLTDLYLGEFNITGATISSLSNALLENNNGISEGMQLSLIVYHQRVNQSSGVPYVICRPFEMIIDTADTRSVFDVYPSNLDTYTTSDGVVLAMNGDDPLSACTFIISSGTGQNIKVSSQSLALHTQLESYVRNWMSEANYNAYVNSYGSTARVDFLATGYSNVGESSSVPIAPQVVSVRFESNDTTPTLLNIFPGSDFSFHYNSNEVSVSMEVLMNGNPSAGTYEVEMFYRDSNDLTPSGSEVNLVGRYDDTSRAIVFSGNMNVSGTDGNITITQIVLSHESAADYYVINFAYDPDVE